LFHKVGLHWSITELIMVYVGNVTDGTFTSVVTTRRNITLALNDYLNRSV